MTRRPFAMLFATVLTLAALAPGLPADAQPVSAISSDLQAKLDRSAPTQLISILVTLRQQPDLTAFRGLDRVQRLERMGRVMRQLADGEQFGVRGFLNAQVLAGRARNVIPLWIFNGLAVTTTPDVVRALAKRPEVRSITPDSTLQAPVMPSVSSGPVEANIEHINAPGLWDRGLRGQGIVVASLDTGVDATHPDLSGRWRGGSNSWFDPYGQHPTSPYDASGHGTWTMGVLVGGNASGSAIGVAPEATWIAAKIFDDRGSATFSGIHQAFQWVLDPDGNPATADAPQVVNNSWTFSVPGCDLTFQPDLQALRAAGILPVFAAGNFGPNSASSTSPANYPEALAVGAEDNVDAIASFSSRGPAACGGPSTVFPRIVAPGVGIRTSDLFGTYYQPSGTSLAAPHVSGLLALLLSGYPHLTADQQELALTSTALDLGTLGADSTYGWGRVDALAAYQSLAGNPGTSTPTPAPTLTATPTRTPDAPTATPSSAPTSTLTAAPTSTPTAAPTGTPTATLSPQTATPTSTAISTPTPGPTSVVDPVLFGDSFESGSLSAWSGASGAVSATTAASLDTAGHFGLRATLRGNGPAYVSNASPAAEAAYRARFLFSPNGATIGAAQEIFVGLDAKNSAIFSVQVRRNGGQAQVREVLQRSGGQSTSAWYAVGDTAQLVEVRWNATRAGSMQLYIDNVLRGALTNLDTSAYRLEAVRLGAVSGASSSGRGAEYFDAFVSSRGTSLP